MFENAVNENKGELFMGDIPYPITEIINHKTVIDIQNHTVSGYKCSAMAAMTIVGDNAYCIKSYGKPDWENKFPIVFYEIKNFNSSNPTKKYWIIKTASGGTSIAMHANSLTYANGIFYIATMNSVGKGSQIVGFSIAGAENASEIRLTEKYTYNKKIYSINYYGTEANINKYLICVGKNEESNYYRFHKVYMSGSEMKQDSGITFIAAYESGFDNGNDSYYDVVKKRLYTTRFIEPASGMIKINNIYQYDLTAGVSGTSSVYEPERIMQVSNNSNEVKFEIEGMAIHDTTRKKYVCANIYEQSGVEGVDALCQLY